MLARHRSLRTPAEQQARHLSTTTKARNQDDTGTGTVEEDHVRVDLTLRTYTPVLIDAAFPELDLPVPWWGGRRLRCSFPPR